jgi:hypothetical protein
MLNSAGEARLQVQMVKSWAVPLEKEKKLFTQPYTTIISWKRELFSLFFKTEGPICMT